MSSLKLVRELELLNEDEMAFLRKKELRERRQFYKAVRAIMIGCFLLPFFAAWVRAFAGAPNAFSYGHYFAGVGVLLGITLTASYLSWRAFLGRVQRDIRGGTKTIERAHITRKLFMPHNSTYFFYLDSPNKLSIEVGGKDYQNMKEGDEVNIEYTTYSQIYLGYF